MKISVYSYRDCLVGYGMPILRDNDAVATRAFKFDVNEDRSMFKSDPKDFQLFRIGEFDTDTGIIDSYDPVLIVNANDLIDKE